MFNDGSTSLAHHNPSPLDSHLLMGKGELIRPLGQSFCYVGKSSQTGSKSGPWP
jgi:hypothetical protein